MILRVIVGWMLLLALPVWMGCRAQQPTRPASDAERFAAYWYQGKAEISSYMLSQARYGAQHDGQAVLVFVTEDMSRKKQVKLDDPSSRSANPVKVLKLNHTRQFVTGLYEYHVMSSVFTPVNLEKDPHSLKVTTSVQDWCGQTYLQANWKGNRYDLAGFSYFESEGDKQWRLPGAWLEDELWTRARIDPSTLPLGAIEIIPSLLHARLAHEEASVREANATVVVSDSTVTYTVRYDDLPRSLTLAIEKTFPHRILSWSESAGDEVTTGTLINTLVTPYWEQHDTMYEPLRDRLRLPR